jgi:hypothetical protein
MNSPKLRDRKKAKFFSVRWITISYKTIALVLIPFLILLIGGLIYLYMSKGSILEEAEIALKTARISIDNANQAGAAEFAKDKIIIAEDLMKDSIDKFDNKDYRLARDISFEARSKAIEAERIAKYSSSNYQTLRYARIQSINGFAEISKTNGNSWQPARNNIILYKGDIIRTHGDANVRIVFEDDSVIRIYPDSYVIISDLYVNPAKKEKRTGLTLGHMGSAEVRADTKSIFKFDLPNMEISTDKNSDVKAKISATGMTGIEVYRGKIIGSTPNENFELNQREKISIDSTRKILDKGTIPFSPIPILPVSMSLFTYPNKEQSKVELRWSKVDRALKYRVQIALDFFFSNVIYESEVELNTNVLVSGLEPNNYFWHVNSIDKDGIESEYCNYRIFKIVYGSDNIKQSQDMVAPSIDLNFINVYGDVVDISGTTEPDSILVVNGKVERVESDGSFRITYTYSIKGKHHIIIEAIDSAGNHSKIVKTVNIDF